MFEFEFLIKYMEYIEFLQAYYESKMFARARRFVIGSPEAASRRNDNSSSSSTTSDSKTTITNSPPMAMSASSIFLSHSSLNNVTVLTNDKLSVSPSLLELGSSADANERGNGFAALFTRNKPAVSTLVSSSLKVKSAAYSLGNQIILDQFEKQSIFF